VTLPKSVRSSSRLRSISIPSTTRSTGPLAFGPLADSGLAAFAAMLVPDMFITPLASLNCSRVDQKLPHAVHQPQPDTTYSGTKVNGRSMASVSKTSPRRWIKSKQLVNSCSDRPSLRAFSPSAFPPPEGQHAAGRSPPSSPPAPYPCPRRAAICPESCPPAYPRFSPRPVITVWRKRADRLDQRSDFQSGRRPPCES